MEVIKIVLKYSVWVNVLSYLQHWIKCCRSEVCNLRIFLRFSRIQITAPTAPKTLGTTVSRRPRSPQHLREYQSWAEKKFRLDAVFSNIMWVFILIIHYIVYWNTFPHHSQWDSLVLRENVGTHFIKETSVINSQTFTSTAWLGLCFHWRSGCAGINSLCPVLLVFFHCFTW